MREVTELSAVELFERWQRYYLGREGDPSSALATNIALIERLETERGDTVIKIHDQDSGALGKIGRMLHLTPMQTRHHLDLLYRRRAQVGHVNGNGKG
jgi:hypothetical protein